MKGYDAWLTTDWWGEQQMAEAEEIINNGMRYWQEQRWTRVNGKVVWACEFCGGLPECRANCWTAFEYED